MKRMMMMLVVAGLVFASCNSKQPEATNTKAEKVELKLADLSDKTDHVCGMELAEGGIADTAQYEGKVYGFCHADCKTAFLKDPKTSLAN